MFLYLVIDVCSRNVFVWDVSGRQDPAIAADLVSRACIRELISTSRRQPLIMRADNRSGTRPATQ
jgi:putative transposase